MLLTITPSDFSTLKEPVEYVLVFVGTKRYWVPLDVIEEHGVPFARFASLFGLPEDTFEVEDEVEEDEPEEDYAEPLRETAEPAVYQTTQNIWTNPAFRDSLIDKWYAQLTPHCEYAMVAKRIASTLVRNDVPDLATAADMSDEELTSIRAIGETALTAIRAAEARQKASA